MLEAKELLGMAAAQRAMARSALYANSSTSVRQKRYTAHMKKAADLEREAEAFYTECAEK